MIDLIKSFNIDKNKVAYRIIGGESMILNLDTGDYYSLGKIETLIWKAIDSQNSFSGLLIQLQKSYNVSKENLKRDISKLIRDLEQASLIKKI
jgi:hypothetical protein